MVAYRLGPVGDLGLFRFCLPPDTTTLPSALIVVVRVDLLLLGLLGLTMLSTVPSRFTVSTFIASPLCGNAEGTGGLITLFLLFCFLCLVFLWRRLETCLPKSGISPALELRLPCRLLCARGGCSIDEAERGFSESERDLLVHDEPEIRFDEPDEAEIRFERGELGDGGAVRISTSTRLSPTKENDWMS